MPFTPTFLTKDNNQPNKEQLCELRTFAGRVGYSNQYAFLVLRYPVTVWVHKLPVVAILSTSSAGTSYTVAISLHAVAHVPELLDSGTGQLSGAPHLGQRGVQRQRSKPLD